MNQPRAFRWAATALYAYASVFVLLSVDVIARVWSLRDHFEQTGDLITILFFETSRSAVVAAAILLGLWLVWKRGEERAMRALAVALALAAVGYAKLAAFPDLPGALQQRTAAWLLGQDVPRELLRFIFGRPAWAAWFALAALLRFAAHYPTPVSVEQIAHSGRADRTGMMRGSAVAGADIGELFRRLAARLVRERQLTPRRLAGGAAALALLHYVLRSAVANVFAALLMAAAFGVAATLLRAAYDVGDAGVRRFLDWLLAGALAAGILFALSAVAGLVPSVTGMLGTVLLALAPVPALLALAAALLRPDTADPSRLLAPFRKR